MPTTFKPKGASAQQLYNNLSGIGPTPLSFSELSLYEAIQNLSESLGGFYKLLGTGSPEAERFTGAATHDSEVLKNLSSLFKGKTLAEIKSPEFNISRKQIEDIDPDSALSIVSTYAKQLHFNARDWRKLVEKLIAAKRGGS